MSSDKSIYFPKYLKYKKKYLDLNNDLESEGGAPKGKPAPAKGKPAPAKGKPAPAKTLPAKPAPSGKSPGAKPAPSGKSPGAKPAPKPEDQVKFLEKELKKTKDQLTAANKIIAASKGDKEELKKTKDELTALKKILVAQKGAKTPGKR